MSPDKLDTYRSKRDAARTPEPVPEPGPLPTGHNDTFVIQEHHARRLHWDLRLERDGVLVSWAIPKCLPLDRKTNHLAVHTEDHPLEYATFEGEIAQGEYGGGLMLIWDRGTYETEKWTDREVKFVLHGSRSSGRYVLFPTDGKNWMIHRMDPPPENGLPPAAELRPMAAEERKRLPRDQEAYGFEFDLGGTRALAILGEGKVRFIGADGTPLTPESTPGLDRLDGLGKAAWGLPAVLDGRIADIGGSTVYMISDVLRLNTGDLLGRSYRDRRRTLDHLSLRDRHWQPTPWFPGDGKAVLQVAKDQGLPAVLAKRLDSPYLPGVRSSAWLRVPLNPGG
ncbi:ATP-dependent DNA ligase [Sphaerisporangium melleum]|uniref:ATP-dependent DNA ligase n=1 Tax=Sphaerisporangium melleum TaxID=321316 RepID=A0A917VGJ6_9ACTN|nr:DNA polymerase ligase N-terminal domain-containing protein [Sphaerisporangium melleum]GGK78534.1 ATP-dependent DNA ligase [Sphaerisporangium melleum]GII69805.1 ATP-dependent DNA ligase [Sphaerisporangium melleum]